MPMPEGPIEAPVIPPRPRQEPPKKQRSQKDGRKQPPFRLFGGFVRSLFTIAVIGVVAAGVAGYGLYRKLEADLPDYRWLAD